MASRSLSIASSTLEVPMKDGPRPSFTASTHQRCHRKPWRRREPADEVRREHVGLAVEGVAGEPDQFLLGEADGAGMIELGAQLTLVDDLGKAHMARAIDDRESHLLTRVRLPNHLQHQQLIEVG